jgi:hypothetical protein
MGAKGADPLQFGVQLFPVFDGERKKFEDACFPVPLVFKNVVVLRAHRANGSFRSLKAATSGVHEILVPHLSNTTTPVTVHF